MKAPAVFIGLQRGYRGVPELELFNLLSPVGRHPEGSTVSRQTLEAHGYVVPSLNRFSQSAVAPHCPLAERAVTA